MTKLLRLVSFLEGVSFILLLGIAMPLKYMMGKPFLVLQAIFGIICRHVPWGDVCVVYCAATFGVSGKGLVIKSFCHRTCGFCFAICSILV